jgi:hypothetical protein
MILRSIFFQLNLFCSTIIIVGQSAASELYVGKFDGKVAFYVFDFKLSKLVQSNEPKYTGDYFISYASNFSQHDYMLPDDMVDSQNEQSVAADSAEGAGEENFDITNATDEELKDKIAKASDFKGSFYVENRNVLLNGESATSYNFSKVQDSKLIDEYRSLSDKNLFFYKFDNLPYSIRPVYNFGTFTKSELDMLYCNADEGCYSGLIQVSCSSADACNEISRALGLESRKLQADETPSPCENLGADFIFEVPDGTEAKYISEISKNQSVRRVCRVAFTAGGTDPAEIALSASQLFDAEEPNRWKLKEKLDAFFQNSYKLASVKITVPSDTFARIFVDSPGNTFCSGKSEVWEHYEFTLTAGNKQPLTTEYQVYFTVDEAAHGVYNGKEPTPEVRQRRLSERVNSDRSEMEKCRDEVVTELGVFLRAPIVSFKLFGPDRNIVGEFVRKLGIE